MSTSPVLQPQPKLAPREPTTRKEAAKEALLDAVFEVKAVGKELVDGFRASDRFFKYRLSIVAAWLALTGVALYVSYPRLGHERANSLDARVRVQQVPALDRTRTALYIENHSREDWGDTLIKLNNTYTHAIADLKAGGKAVVTLDKFSGSGGATPPEDLKPQRLEISCMRGRTEVDLTELEKQRR